MKLDTTQVLLIRHARTDVIGHRLTGRMPGVHLNAVGRAEAHALPARLRGEQIDAIYSSPLERALETAEPLARARGLPVRPCEDANEFDFGDWTGLTFETLERLPDWTAFNARRGSAGAPGGERAVDVQARIVRALSHLAARHPSQTVVLVSHAEVIRSAVLYHRGVPLDRFYQVEIAPASVTPIGFAQHAATVYETRHALDEYPFSLPHCPVSEENPLTRR